MKKGREALASCLAVRGGDLGFGVGASVAGGFGRRALRLTGSAPGFLACRQPKTLAVRLQHVDMVREAVEERADPKTDVHSSDGRRAGERFSRSAPAKEAATSNCVRNATGFSMSRKPAFFRHPW